ncbi:hypothetical protein NIES267_35650 [Calothrix parasitica NIES-267]|uniref:Uncharacterized protein n=1 Tax=Calothrix parasitica NIES-267 TaxID=1973488 RepID=A0A1Z4LS54_9CYAN|nr:hypothetical protein NIES267_35650 [Calothrix parasitica NIES-267]
MLIERFACNHNFINVIAVKFKFHLNLYQAIYKNISCQIYKLFIVFPTHYSLLITHYSLLITRYSLIPFLPIIKMWLIATKIATNHTSINRQKSKLRRNTPLI